MIEKDVEDVRGDETSSPWDVNKCPFSPLGIQTCQEHLFALLGLGGTVIPEGGHRLSGSLGCPELSGWRGVEASASPVVGEEEVVQQRRPDNNSFVVKEKTERCKSGLFFFLA